MPSISPARILLPAARSLAEGSWLAVLYAALQAMAGEIAYVGPIELGTLVVAGMAWSGRSRWRSPTTEALGLPLLALLAGILGWLESPVVRASIIDGNLLNALSQHIPGWLAALAFWRGDAHRTREDVVIEERLMGWALPGLAIPWLIGYSAASGQLQDHFAAAAFIGTIFFVGSAFTALGIARLEALRLSTGTDWRGDRSWLLMVLGLALGLTVLSIPVAALLGISGRSLLAVMAGPLQTLILLIVALTAPAFFLAAAIATWLGPLVPEGFRLDLNLPTFNPTDGGSGSDLPRLILSILVGSIFLFDLLVVVALLWFAHRNRRQRDGPPGEAFEERAIVVPPPAPPAAAPRPASRPLVAHFPDDAIGAYLAALDSLAADGRWPRREHETPAAHVQRTRGEGLGNPAFGRLAAAYQLSRYTPDAISPREAARAATRLATLRQWLARV